MKGAIVERGTHQGLLEANGLYASMWNEQLKDGTPVRGGRGRGGRGRRGGHAPGREIHALEGPLNRDGVTEASQVNDDWSSSDSSSPRPNEAGDARDSVLINFQ